MRCSHGSGQVLRRSGPRRGTVGKGGGGSHRVLEVLGTAPRGRGKRVLVLVAYLDVRVIGEDGVMLRHLELDPSVDYQGRPRDIV